MEKKSLNASRYIIGNILLLALVAVGYFFLARHMIMEAYHGRGLAFLVDAIGGRDVHPLQYYVGKADALFVTGLFAMSCFVWLLYCVRKVGVGAFAKIVLINAAILVVFFELMVVFLLANPSLVRYVLYDYIRSLYRHGNTKYIQYTDYGSRYDPELAYTLKPGEFMYSSQEFDTHYFVNSSGVRDDEDSLRNPQVISLGDSYAMGWGVEQDETYAAVLEKLSGKKVLNAGISSYGTVREMMLLDRLDTSAMETLIVQYDDNDFGENNILYHEQGLPIMSEESFLNLKKHQAETLRYFPGEYLGYALQLMWKELLHRGFDITLREKDESDLFGIERKAYTQEPAAFVFLQALMSAGNTDISHAHLIFILPAPFVDAVNEELSIREYPPYIQNAHIVPLPDRVTERDCYFIIDGHINKRGHQVVGERLFDLITKR